MERLLTARQSWERLSISGTKFWQLVARGEMPVVRIGRAVRVRPADIEAYITSRMDGARNEK